MAQRVGRGIALLFHDRGTRRSHWSAARRGRTLPPEKNIYPFYRRLGGPQGRSERAEILVHPAGIRSQNKVHIFTENQIYRTVKRTNKQRRKRNGINKNISTLTLSRVRVTTFAMKTQHFLCIVARVYVIVCITKRLRDPTEMQQWILFFYCCQATKHFILLSTI